MNDFIVDDMARAMTDVEAPLDLRARVLSEIGRPRSRWVARALPFAAAASIVTVGIVALRPLLTEGALPTVARTSLVQLAAADPAPNIVVVQAASRVPRILAAISPDELAWLSRRLPPLETRALALEPIQPAPPSIAPISVEPITLEPISVPPPGAGTRDRR